MNMDYSPLYRVEKQFKSNFQGKSKISEGFSTYLFLYLKKKEKKKLFEREEVILSGMCIVVWFREYVLIWCLRGGFPYVGRVCAWFGRRPEG